MVLKSVSKCAGRQCWRKFSQVGSKAAPAAGGLSLYRIAADDFMAEKKMILIK
jgi:hypothetical protein